MKGQSGNSRGDDPGLSRGSDMAVSRTGGDTTPTVGPRASSSYSIMNHTFRVNARYSALKAVGKGSFGVVCSAADEKQVSSSAWSHFPLLLDVSVYWAHLRTFRHTNDT